MLIGRGRPKAAGAADNFSPTSTGNVSLLSAGPDFVIDAAGGAGSSIAGRLGDVWKDNASEAPDAAESSPRQISVAGEAGALAYLLLEGLSVKLAGWENVLLRAESAGSVRPETPSMLPMRSGTGENPLLSERGSG